MKRLVLSLLTAACAVGGYAQGKIVDIAVIHDSDIGGNTPSAPVPAPKKTRALVGTAQRGTVLVKNTTYETSDAVLYADVVRRYTWLEGVGKPITQEVANKLPYYYRLSLRNAAGHYQQVEAMHGTSLTAAHPLSTYIIDKNDDKAETNRAWCERLQRVGKWVLYSDASGERVVEERAFEAKKTNAELVYSMIPVRNDSNHVTISYLDAWGYPADMNETVENTYGSVVYITYDANGYDSVIDYLDGEGYRKTNTDGVDQKRYKHDKSGRVVLATSNNCVGDNVIDNWGNCGVRYSYDDARNAYTVTYVDSDLRPMQMPALRADGEQTFVSCTYTKDRWGRKAEAVMTDADGKPSVTLSGIHRITYTYGTDGKVTKTYYRLNGETLEL